MRKRKLALTACLLAAACMIIAACSSSGNAETTAETTTQAAAETETTAAESETTASADGSATTQGEMPDMSGQTLNFSSDVVGSGSYNIIVAMGRVLEDVGGFATVNVTPDNPGGMGAPYLFGSDGTTDLAFINGAPAKWASEEGTLGREPASGYLAAIGGLTASCYINCITNSFLDEYGVSSIEEIFEQHLPLRIGCSTQGSMDAQGAYLLLDYFGVTEEDLESWGGSITNQGGDANADAIADGQIDFYIDHTTSASSTMAQIATTVDVTFLQWGDELCDWFINEQGFSPTVVPAGSFKGQDEELTLPGSPDCIFVREDLDEDVVYAITRCLNENRDALVEQYNALSPWEPENACDETYRGGVALHPGAERYYTEMGYM